MQIGTNIDRGSHEAYEVRFSPIETKQRRRIEARLSKKLNPFIEQWLMKIRPVLTKGRVTNAMWIGKAGSDLTPTSFYYRFCKITKKLFHVRFNPHFVRKIVATHLAISHPDLVSMTSSLLDQTSDQSKAYNLADQLSASKQYIALLEARRGRALKSIARTPLQR